MITLNYKKQHVKIPDKWDELTTLQYLDVCSALLNFDSFDSLTEFRMQVLSILTGYQRSKKKFTEKEVEQINDNLFILAQMVTFPVKPYYTNPDVLEVLGVDLQNELQHKFPTDITNAEHLQQLSMIADVLQYSVQPYFNMKRNPLPEITKNDVRFLGPRFDIMPTGMVINDITAREYLLANEYMGYYYQTGNSEYLKYLAGILYRNNRNDIDENNTVYRGELIDRWDSRYKYAVLIFFQNILYFISNTSKYSLLFRRPKGTTDNSEKLHVDTIMGLVKKGYGTTAQLENIRFDQYLEMLLNEITDAVHELRSYKKNDVQISQQLNLPIETIMQI